MKQLENHPAAEIFPMATEDELKSLAEDIRKNGLLEPIVLIDGKILDGRNRALACSRAGVPIKTTDWQQNGKSPTEYVISKNLHRRHLTVSQRAAIAADSAELLREEARMRQEQSRALPGERVGTKVVPKSAPPSSKGRVREIAARAVGVGKTSVQDAINVRKADPELHQKVKSGEVPLQEARKIVKKGSESEPETSEVRRIPESSKYRAQYKRLITVVSEAEGLARVVPLIEPEKVVSVCGADELIGWADRIEPVCTIYRRLSKALRQEGLKSRRENAKTQNKDD